MKIKQADLAAKVVEIAKYFNVEKDAAWYHPRPCGRLLAYMTLNGSIRSNWTNRASEVKRELVNLAKEINSKKSDNYMHNFVQIMRVARMLDGYSGGEVELAGTIDQNHWNKSDIPADELHRDYEAIRKGKYALHASELYQDGSAQPAPQPQQEQPQPAQPAPAAASPIQQGGGGFEVPRWLWTLLGVILFGLLAVIGWQLFGDQLSGFVASQPQAVPSIDPNQPAQPESGFSQALRQAQEAAGVTSVPQVGPEGNAVPGGAPISSPLQSIQQTFLLGISVLSQIPFWIQIILGFAIAYMVFKDARARASEGDFAAFMRLMGLVALLAVLPVKALVQIDLTIWNWYFPMPTSYNLIILAIAASGLWGIAQDRMTDELDLTPLSAGLFIAGIIFFTSNAVAFLSWQVPLETYIAWGAALIVHLVEMVRQEDTKEALILTAVGIVLQLVIFFGFAWALGTTASPFFLAYGQEISFLISVFLSVGLVSFGLNLLSEQNLLPAGGQMLMHVQTSSHDAGLLILMWSVGFMSQYWV